MSVEIELNAIDNMSKVFKSIERQMNVFEKTLKGLDSTLDGTSISTKESTGQYLKNAAAGWAMNAGLNAAAQGVQMVGQGVRDGFDAFVNLEAVSARLAHQIEGVSFKELTDDIKSFASESWFNTAQVTSAFDELATIGNFTIDEIDTLIASSEILALAIGSNLDEAARITAKTLNAFNLEITDSSRVIDILTNAASVSDLTVRGLTSSFGSVAGQAKALNIDLVDVVTAIGMIADEAAVGGEQAGTFLGMFLTKIADPTKQGAEAMEKLGVSFFDASGNMRDMGTIFEELAAARDRFNPQEYAQLLSDAFERRGKDAVLNITQAIRDNGTAWSDYKAAIEETGTAMEIAGDISDTSAGKIRRMQSSIEGLAIDLGGILAEFVIPVIDTVTAVGEIAKAGDFKPPSDIDLTAAKFGIDKPRTQSGTGTTPYHGGAGDLRNNYQTTIIIEGNVTDENLDEIIKATNNSGSIPNSGIA